MLRPQHEIVVRVSRNHDVVTFVVVIVVDAVVDPAPRQRGARVHERDLHHHRLSTESLLQGLRFKVRNPFPIPILWFQYGGQVHDIT